MPYTKGNPPDRIKGLPEHAQAVWVTAFNSALKEYDGDEGKANAAAWAAVKKAGYKKNDKGEWVKMADTKFNCECIDCGHKVQSEQHCADLVCPECGGAMRREERPGPGRYSDEPNFDEVEIFRAGAYPQGTITESDLDEIVANFNPHYHEPPVTKDHVQDGQAYGWVEKVWRKGAVLYAKMREVAKDLVEDIRTGRYKKRSVEIWEDFEGTGKKVLKAVTWLGARPPQVKGMANVFAYGLDAPHGHVAVFSDSSDYAATDEEKKVQKARGGKYGISIVEGGHVTKPGEWSSIPDEQWGDPVNYAYPCPDADQTRAALKYWGMPRNKGRYSTADQAKVSERLRKFAKKFNIESEILKHSEAEMTPEEVKKAIDDALAKQSETLTAKFSEDIKGLRDENANLKKQIDEKEKKFSDEQKAAKVDTLIDGLLKDHKIIPALRDAGLKQFMLGLDDSKIIEFGENKKSMTDWIVEVFGEKLPTVNFSEFAKPEKTDKINAGMATQFKVVEPGEAISGTSWDLHEKTLKLMADHNAANPTAPISYRDALLQAAR